MLAYVPDVIFDVCKPSDALEYLLHLSEKGKACCPHADIVKPVLDVGRMLLPENDADDVDQNADVFRPVLDGIPETLFFDEHAFMENVDTLSFVKALSSHTERLTTFHRSVQSFCMSFDESVGGTVQRPEIQYEDSNSQTSCLGIPHDVLSYVVLPCVVLCCLVLACLVLCSFVSTCAASCCVVLSCLVVLCCVILFRLLTGLVL
jgi:hypothetical protein